ncbi:MAG: hypothetical protein IKB93_10455 [Clostridia bacterium]|nr:hypothetical protein [Clostridia bacterium]
MDLEQEISKALADPDIMNKVSGVLSSLGNGSDTNKESNSSEQSQEKGIANVLGNLGGAVVDDRTRLLMAIKPFLSQKRAPYMDSAVTILKLASMGKLGKDLKLF